MYLDISSEINKFEINGLKMNDMANNIHITKKVSDIKNK